MQKYKVVSLVEYEIEVEAPSIQEAAEAAVTIPLSYWTERSLSIDEVEVCVVPKEDDK